MCTDTDRLGWGVCRAWSKNCFETGPWTGGMERDGGPRQLLQHVLIPVAHEDDARRTAAAFDPYDLDRITLVYVVEKGGGAPDKTPVEHSKEVAAEAFAAFRESYPDAEDRLVYETDIVGAILDAADEVDASAIAYCPRKGGRLMQLLSGDHARKLTTRADRPVVTLPQPSDVA